VAVKTLAKIRNLDNIPTLVYALSDPDLRVMVEARDGLRFISRKFQGFALNDAPTDQQREAAAESWKGWYREIRPNAFFSEN
jgi:HEAT repeat protein